MHLLSRIGAILWLTICFSQTQGTLCTTKALFFSTVLPNWQVSCGKTTPVCSPWTYRPIPHRTWTSSPTQVTLRKWPTRKEQLTTSLKKRLSLRSHMSFKTKTNVPFSSSWVSTKVMASKNLTEFSAWHPRKASSTTRRKTIFGLYIITELSQNLFLVLVSARVTFRTSLTHFLEALTQPRSWMEKKAWPPSRTTLGTTSQTFEAGPWTPRTSCTMASLFSTRVRPKLTLRSSTQARPSLLCHLITIRHFRTSGRRRLPTSIARPTLLSVRPSCHATTSLPNSTTSVST